MTSTQTFSIIHYPCVSGAEGDCRWIEVHHVDAEGRHWCPTGIIRCIEHGGVGETTLPCASESS